MTGFME